MCIKQFVPTLMLVAAGCAVPQPGDRSWAAGVPDADLPRMAGVIGDTLATSVDPGIGWLEVAAAEGPSGLALDKAVRVVLVDKGFKLVAPDSRTPAAHILRYAVMPIDARMMVRVDVEQAEATCLFDRDSSGRLMPIGPCAVRLTTALALRPQTAFQVEAVSVPAESVPSKVVRDPDVPINLLASSGKGSETPKGLVRFAASAPARVVSVPVLPEAAPLAAAAVVAVVAVVPVSPQTAAPVILPLAMVPVSVEQWTLHAGDLVGKQLVAWGRKSGWTVLWEAPVDWPAPATTQFVGPFPTVAETVVSALRSNGADIRGRAYLPNSTLVISAAGGYQKGGQ